MRARGDCKTSHRSGALVNARLGGADNPAPAELAGALHLVFVAALGAAVVLVVAAAAMPKSASAPDVEPSAPTSDRRL